MSRTVTDAQIAEARRLRASGLVCSEIAQRLHMADSTVEYYTGDLTAQSKEARRVREAALVAALQAGGKTIAEISAALGRSKATVCRRANEAAAHQKRGVLTDADHQLLALLLPHTPPHAHSPQSGGKRGWCYHGVPIRSQADICRACRWRMNKAGHTVCGVCYREAIDRKPPRSDPAAAKEGAFRAAAAEEV